MAGRSPLVASAGQEAELRALSRSDVRGETDRARAILLTLRGWTSLDVTEALGVTPGVVRHWQRCGTGGGAALAAVRHWRGWFAGRGVDVLRSTLAPGPSATKGERALEAQVPCCANPSRTGPTGRCRGWGPKSGCDRPLVLLVLDNGPVHTGKASRAALAERPWITVEWLPRYARN